MDGSEDGECGEAGQQGKSQQARATHQPTSGRHQPTSIESKVCDLTSYIRTRAVESGSREVGKSLKIGKNRIKSEKSDLISY